MDKEALLHKPENPATVGNAWESQRALSAKLDQQVNEFLKKGGQIEQIQFGVMADADNSQCAINARTWYIQHPDAVPVTGGVHITDAMLQYANKRLARKGGVQAPNMHTVAKELGVDEVALRREVTKHRARIAAKNGAKKANSRHPGNKK